MSLGELQTEIFGLIDKYFASNPPAFEAAEGRVPLNMPSYGADEVKEALDSMLSSFVTMGKKVAQFEKDFAAYVGAKHALMVNSGSSANLLALAVLANPAYGSVLKPGDEVIVPAVTWSTTLWPVVNMGATPVLVDVDRRTLNIDPAAVEAAITPKTKAIFVVHLLGNPAQMDQLMAIAEKHKLILIEDTCESLGAEFGGKKVGTFGLMGTYSTYFSHHMTTIEGGMVVTDDDEAAELLRMLRSHGWTRHLVHRQEVEALHADLDPRFLFVNIGYNLRATDVQAAFGIHQLRKLDGFNQTRARSTIRLREKLAPVARFLEFPQETPGGFTPWFGFPMFVTEDAPFTRQELQRHLEAKGIETRPIVAGNLAVQPALKLYAHRIGGPLPAADHIMARGIFFANHGMMKDEEIDYIAEQILAFCQTHQLV